MSKKKVFLLVILLIVFIFFSAVILKKVRTNEGIIFKSNLKIEFRDEVYINELIESIDGELVDNFKIDTNEVGFFNLDVYFKNKYGFTVKKDVIVEIIDVTPPVVIVNNPYKVVKGSITNLLDSIFCADNYDDLISCNISGDYDLERIGKYNLVISASDNSGNITEKEFVLDIIEKKNNNNNYSSGVYTYTDFRKIYNKYKNEDTEVGLDISKWQGDVNYSKLKEQGVDFVMIKIGGQTEIGGEFKLDPRFYDNIKGAIDNDIKVGVYFYSYAKSVDEAIKQADWIHDKLEGYNINMPIVFDWENWGKFTMFHISFHTLNKVATGFIDRVESMGYDGVLYSSKYYLENIWYKDEYINWLAYYNDEFDNYKDYYMWQMCSDGKIDGIDGYVDIDIRYKG